MLKSYIVFLSLRLPFTSNSLVGLVVAIPTNPVLAETVKNVPPTPTFNPVSPTSNPFPTVKIPTVLLNTKSDDVEKSSRYVPTPELAFGSKILSLNKKS